MTRVEFDKHLRELKDELLEMGSMVEKALARAIDALKRRDMEMARLIVEDDSKINKKRFDIEEKCVELIATQQPLARDLRQIVSILHMTVDLERMGDYAEGIAGVIDQEIDAIIRNARNTALRIIRDRRDFLNRIVEHLLEKETIEQAEFDALFEEAAPSHLSNPNPPKKTRKAPKFKVAPLPA